jgi:AcrR family transcriptional regulator
MNSTRLTPLDWINAGFRALVKGGVQALRVEPVAKDLGTTKGSFYWHFKGPHDWHAAMLDHFETLGFSAIVDRLPVVPAGASRLRALARIAVLEGRDKEYGGAEAEMALRDWARFNPLAAQSVQRVDAGREGYVLQEMRAAGVVRPEAAATLFYAAYLGFQAKGSTPDTALAGLDDLLDRLGLPAVISEAALKL